MTTTKSWLLALTFTSVLSGECARSADFALTAAELARVNAREVVVRATLDAGQRKGMVRAAVLIQAAPPIVFRQMTRCQDALQYVPHLRACRVRDHAADGS